MEFVREVIDTDKLAGIIEIPEKLKKSKVELILLPINEPDEKLIKKEKNRKKNLKKLYANPIKVKKIDIPPREKLHER